MFGSWIFLFNIWDYLNDEYVIYMIHMQSKLEKKKTDKRHFFLLIFFY